MGELQGALDTKTAMDVEAVLNSSKKIPPPTKRVGDEGSGSYKTPGAAGHSNANRMQSQANVGDDGKKISPPIKPVADDGSGSWKISGSSSFSFSSRKGAQPVTFLSFEAFQGHCISNIVISESNLNTPELLRPYSVSVTDLTNRKFNLTAYAHS